MVSPASARQASTRTLPDSMASVICTLPRVKASTAIPTAKPRPPSRFIHRAWKLLCTASSVRV